MRTEHCSLCGKPQPAPADPLKAQAATPGRLAGLTRGLTRAQLLQRPAPGKWSIHDANHLGQIERIRKSVKKSREPRAGSRVPAR